MTIKDLLNDIEVAKESIKMIKHEMNEELDKNTDFANAKEDLKLSREVVAFQKRNLIESSGELTAKFKKLTELKGHIKDCKTQLYGRVRAVDLETGEQLTLELKF